MKGNLAGSMSATAVATRNVPQARVLNLAQSMATKSYAFVGSAVAEMKATDSVSGQLLAEAVDKRAAGMGLKSAVGFISVG
jgi:hypothetical protein